jgi:hypothetical protein
MRPKNERPEDPAAAGVGVVASAAEVAVGVEETAEAGVAVDETGAAGHAAGRPLTGSGATQQALTTFL